MKLVLNILLAVMTAWALLPLSAYAEGTDGAEPAGSAVESTEAPSDEAAPENGSSPLIPSICQVIQSVATPIVSIDKSTLFQHHYYWEAVENLDFESANEDGSLSEWQQDWFIAHDWSNYGGVIANLNPGDAVTVNDQTVLILGKEIWPQGAINWDIYDAIGWDKVVFQTCLGEDSIWIVYGIPVNPTPDFLAQVA